MNYFFVTGLPRSGSAWVANYLSYGSVMCVHDAWKLGTPEEIKSKMDHSGVLSAGVADCSNVIILDQLDKTFPKAKWIVITRSPKDVEESCNTIGFPFVDWTEKLKRLMSQKDVLKVPFVKLFDEADKIGRFVCENWSCPSWRKAQLKDLNVQLHWGRVSEQFKVPETLKQSDALTPTKMEFLRLLGEIVNQDAYAIRFLTQAMKVSELYKRLDQGRAIDIGAAKDVLEAITTEWMISPFTKNYSASLVPAIVSAIEAYANDPEARYCPIDLNLVTVVTYIFKGNEGVREFMPKVRELSDKIKQES